MFKTHIACSYMKYKLVQTLRKASWQVIQHLDSVISLSELTLDSSTRRRRIFCKEVYHGVICTEEELEKNSCPP